MYGIEVVSKYSTFHSDPGLNGAEAVTGGCDEDVIPTSLRIEPKVRTREGYAIAERASKAFLRARIHQTFCRKQSLIKQITKLEASLEKDLLTEDYSKITKLSHNSAEKTFVNSKQNHKSKLEALLKHKQKQPEVRPEGVGPISHPHPY